MPLVDYDQLPLRSFSTRYAQSLCCLVGKRGYIAAFSSPARHAKILRIPELIHIPAVSPGKARLAKWFIAMSPQAKAKIVKDVTQLVLARKNKMCNVIEYKGECVVCC